MEGEISAEQIALQKSSRKNLQYSRETLQIAVNEVKNKEISAYGASKKFSIPKSTILNKVNEVHSSAYGKTPVLSAEVEKELADWIIDCGKLGDPKSKEDLINAAAELALLNEEESKHFKNNKPCSKWVTGFLKRNPNVSFRKPSAITRAAANVTPGDLQKSVDNTKQFLIDNNMSSVLNDPKAWGNSDETGFDRNPKVPKVLAPKGAQNVYQVECTNPKERISVMYTALASGDVLKPQIILDGSCSALYDMAYACGGKQKGFFL